WAPDVAYFNDRYHVYYSVSEWGTIDSVIGLATSPSLVSPVWTDQGKVVQSDAIWEIQPETDTTSYNCIDPAIFQDTNGTIWMVYGSYSDGILVTQIDPSTGKRLNSNSIGTRIANNGPNFFSNTTEGAHIHQRGGYYWLFLNFGGCCSGVNSTYNIRVGRSASVTGPYLDKSGVNMINGGGTMLLESTGRFIGPGHPAIFVESGTNWFTYHYYNGNANGAPTLGLNQLHWAEDGWPALTNDWSALYTFDTDAREHRAIYNGNLRSGASITNEPDRGRMLQLDGNANHVTLPLSVANSKSFAAWVKWNGGDDWQRIFDFGTSMTNYLFLTPRAFQAGMRVGIRNGSGVEQQINAPFALPTDSWCHVAVTLDGPSGVLYFNGEPVGTNNNLTIRPWQLLARSNFLGKSQFAADPNFNGRIDSFRVFSRALAPSEVLDMAWTHPALAHRYSFNGGTNAWDSIGMAHGTLVGNAVITNGALKLTGATGSYVNLPGGLVSGSSAVSVEFWASFGVNGNWARVFDFGNISGGNGQNFHFFTPHSGSGGLRLGISTGGGTVNFDPPGTFDNQSLHVVCITDPVNGYMAIYTNGLLRAATNTALPALTGVNASWAFIGRSLFSSDAWLNATIDELRIYDGRLAPEEIAVNYQSGPDALALPVALTQADSPSDFTLRWPSWALGFVPESKTSFDPDSDWLLVSPQTTLSA
ncbi:MAG TPA: family 43 glycosylhydrolase, partial [Verrucomicrobiota bacterium]|nr:family 43 glycosylhydrolase [Verrucomicrobiota bacterium]